MSDTKKSDTAGDDAHNPRDQILSERMSEHEALMWNIEKDPWLNPNGASLAVLDEAIDMDRFRRIMRYAVSQMPRLYQRVVPGFGRLSTPAWVPDAEFEFDYHLRSISLPKPGTERQLMDLATQLYLEPLDRTRPLWRFVAIEGLEGGRGALYMLTHHAVSDGIGQMRMAEMYQKRTRDAEPPPEVDLEGIVAAAVAEHRAKEQGGDLATDVRSTVTRSLTHLVRRQVGISRRVAGELALWPADPSRASGKIETVAETAQGALDALGSGGGEEGDQVGSPLWAKRSRHRHLESVRVPLDDLKTAAKFHGASINDAFLAVMTEAAHRYHTERDVEVDRFRTSFVLSTRTDKSSGGNAFTPVPITVSGRAMSMAERLDDIRTVIETARESTSKSGGMTALSGVANLLPTSVVTKAARAQARKLDFATSNLRGARSALHVANGQVEYSVTMGPLAGTPCNATALSSAGSFDVGLFMDPDAIEDPQGFRDHVEASFMDLIASAD